MNLPRVTSRLQAFNPATWEPVSAEYAILHPSGVVWRNVTTDIETGEESIVHPANAPESEVAQDEVK